MNEKSCPVCGDAVQSRRACIMEHFAFYAPGTLRYWRGNIVAFGWADGLRSSIIMPPPDHG